MAESVLRNWPLVVLPVALALAAAFIATTQIKATYTAQTRLNVGRLDVSTQAIPGYAAGIQSLAVAYARAITGDDVVNPVATKLHLRPGQVAGNLSASPVPQAPLIIVEATGKSAASAVNLANSASDELVAFLTRINLENPDAARLLVEYRKQAETLNRLGFIQARAKRRYDITQIVTDRDTLAAATANFQEQDLRVNALKSSYLSSQQGGNSASLVQVLNRAGRASSDKRSRAEAILFGAAVIGLLIGVALAVWRSRIVLRRVQISS